MGVKIGVLGMQGDIREHMEFLKKLGVDVVLVKLPKHLESVDGLIIPGGESTTIWKLLKITGLDVELKRMIEEGLPVYGTCAGMIVLSKGVENYPDQRTLEVIDIKVRRNAYGRQVESFETDLKIKYIDGKPFRGVFIRAPLIVEHGKGVEILSTYEDKPVMARQENILVSSFHPELTNDTRVHEFFLQMI